MHFVMRDVIYAHFDQYILNDGNHFQLKNGAKKFFCWVLLSIFVLFLDLVAAYDSVIREIAMGLPHNIDHAGRMNYLLGIGIPNDIAKHVLEYLDLNGPVFNQAGVDAKAARMFNALHTRSWAVYGSLESIVISNKGGR